MTYDRWSPTDNVVDLSVHRSRRTLRGLTDRIFLGDCMDMLTKLPDDSVDVCFADPPFNLNKKYLGGRDRMSEDDYVEWCRKWLDHLVRVTKPTGSVLVHNIPKWLTRFAAILNENKDAHFRHWIAWNSPGRPLGKTLQPSHYGILFYVKDPKRFKYYDLRAPHKRCRICQAFATDYGGKEHLRHKFGMLVGDVWNDIHRIRHNKRRLKTHPCQLPVHLLERLILMTSDADDVILDPFMGAGTTAIAAKKLGRKFIGSETSPEYRNAALAHLEEVSETKHNDVYVSEFLGKAATVRDCDIPALTTPSGEIPLAAPKAPPKRRAQG